MLDASTVAGVSGRRLRGHRQAADACPGTPDQRKLNTLKQCWPAGAARRSAGTPTSKRGRGVGARDSSRPACRRPWLSRGWRVVQRLEQRLGDAQVGLDRAALHGEAAALMLELVAQAVEYVRSAGETAGGGAGERATSMHRMYRMRVQAEEKRGYTSTKSSHAHTEMPALSGGRRAGDAISSGVTTHVIRHRPRLSTITAPGV